MHEIKAADFYEDFGKDKMFDFSNYLTKSKFYDELLVKWKMKQIIFQLKKLLIKAKNIFVLGRC